MEFPVLGGKSQCFHCPSGDHVALALGLYLSVNFMQSVLQGSVHILSSVSEGQREVVPTRYDWNQLPICTVGHK